MVFGESQSLAIAALTGAGVLKALLARSAPSSSSGPAELKFSHMGIFATNPEALGSFYEEVLGFTRTDKGEMPGPGGKLMELVFLSRDPEEHHQIVMVSGRPADLAFNVVNQISLSTTSLGEVKQMYALLKERQDITELLTVTHGNGAALPPRPNPATPPPCCRPTQASRLCWRSDLPVLQGSGGEPRRDLRQLALLLHPAHALPHRPGAVRRAGDSPNPVPQSPRKHTRYTPSILVAECAQRPAQI